MAGMRTEGWDMEIVLRQCHGGRKAVSGNLHKTPVQTALDNISNNDLSEDPRGPPS